jgi:hypothetical protein
VVDDKIGTVALRDVEDLRAHLDPWRRHCEGPQLEAFGFLELLDHRDRLATRRVVVEDVGDLFAFETAAELLLDVLDGRRTLRKVGRSDREQIGKAFAVGGRSNTETRRGARDLVLGELLVQRLNLRRAVDHDRGRTFPLHPLVGLDRGGHLVFVIDLHVFDFVAFDAARGIDQVVIILKRRAYPGPIDLSSPGAVAHPADHHLLLLGAGNRGEAEPGCDRQDRDR